ncbi:MAG: hypothetical protein J6Y89_09470, partial [Lachnospiraceae bacterium]|nr:hypothetical protein [Lachnospiraceae bacterium]
TVSTFGPVPAKAVGRETKLQAKSNVGEIVAVPGQTTHARIPVEAKDGGGNLQIFSLSANASTDLIRIYDLKFINISTEEEVMSTSSGYHTYDFNDVAIDFYIVSDPELDIDNYTVEINGRGIDYIEAGETGDYNKTDLPLLDVTVVNKISLNPAYLNISSMEYDADKFIPGKTTDVTFNIKNEGEIGALNVYMTLDFAQSGVLPANNVSRIKIGDLAAGASKKLTVSVKILENATPGLVPLSVAFEGKSSAKNHTAVSSSQTLYVTVKKPETVVNAKLPSLSLSTDANYSELVRGDKMKIPITIKNDGKATAKSVTLEIVSGVGSSVGVTKDYTSDVMEIGDIAAGKSSKVKVPITVSEDVAAGLHEFVFEIHFKNEDGSILTNSDGSEKTERLSMYLEAKPKPEEDKKPDLYNYLDIHNVSQSPESPAAGSKISVSFEITNNGNGKVKNLRVFGQNLSGNGFEPLTNEPYQTVGDLAAGASKKTSMTFKVGENIPNGTNLLTIGYEFIDENGDKKTDSASIYILNVQGKDDETKDVGRPKLIISDYNTDADILRAGEVFNFSFSIKNTHQTKSAKNIKVTVSQAEGIFSPSYGTNIFYVDEIEAGQVSVQTMPLKTRADATTGDYEIQIKLEYEYDDMSTADREKGGVSEENAIKLRATENYRPVIENISLDAWEGCYVGVPVDMNFEFYNMGKSTLGNVYVTVEGDFALANNSQMSYVGAIQGYGQEFISPQVVALVEGDATGILTVHFEDSNGDEVTLSQEFTQYVQTSGGGYYNPGYDDPGYIDPGEWDNPDINPDGGDDEGGFFSKIKPWMWICGASVIVLAVAIPLIVHGVKKSKKAKVDEDEDY